MRRAIAIGLMLLSASVVQAQNKTTAFSGGGGSINTSTFPGSVLGSTSLRKGQRKHVLLIQASAYKSSVHTSDGAWFLNARVNGQAAHGEGGYNACPAFTNCTITAHFFFDVDAEEALSPGQFVGMPLTVELFGVAYGGLLNGSISTTLTVMNLKK